METNEKVKQEKQKKSTRLMNKSFIALLFSYGFSLFGQHLLNFALPLYVLQATGSATVFGSIVALAFLPMILTSPIGGVFADRVCKRRLIVILQSITALLIFLFIWASGFLSITPIIVILMMGVYAVVGLTNPVVDASVPQIVPEAQIVRGGGMVGSAGQISEFVAPMVAGVLFATAGLMPIVVISGICYVISAVSGAFMKIPHVKQVVPENVSSMINSDIQTTVKFLSKDNPLMLKIVLVLAMLGLILIPILPIGLPILITSHLGLSSEMLGFGMGGAVGLGGIIGGITASVIGDKLKMKDCPKLILFECIIMIPIGVVFLLNLGTMVSFIVIVVAAMLIMVTSTLLMIRIYGYIQVETPEEIMGKVISVVTMLVLCAQPLGFFLYGLLFERLQDAPWAVILFAAIASLGITVYSVRYFREIDVLLGIDEA